jgi:hypothetical protein
MTAGLAAPGRRAQPGLVPGEPVERGVVAEVVT